jgi:putative membrane protein
MNWYTLVTSSIYAVSGLLIFCLGFWLIDLLTPYNLWQELVEKRNTALGFVVGMVALGLCLIIAAAIHG